MIPNRTALRPPLVPLKQTGLALYLGSTSPRVKNQRLPLSLNKILAAYCELMLLKRTSSKCGSQAVTPVSRRSLALRERAAWFLNFIHDPDVGGGSVTDITKNSLAQIPLRWMVRQVITANCGIQFDETAFARNGLPELSSFASCAPTKASEEELALNKANALEPIHDQLKKKPFWWLLEIIPLHFSWQNSKGVWNTDYGYVIFMQLVYVSLGFYISGSIFTDYTWLEVATLLGKADVHIFMSASKSV